MQLFFEDLALPHLLRTALGDNPQWKSHRAGYTHDGTPNNLAVVRSMRGALGRGDPVVRGVAADRQRDLRRRRRWLDRRRGRRRAPRVQHPLHPGRERAVGR